ncbi:MAG: four helix bundle protein, partial [Armatimonadetes bacterium]|nr:four helix bundle protein [Armatimonadota bacterium]
MILAGRALFWFWPGFAVAFGCRDDASQSLEALHRLGEGEAFAALQKVQHVAGLLAGEALEALALGSQIQRAVVSVPANIAEGQAREMPKAFANHLGIA